MLVIAHRGASIDFPDNTLAAYRAAVEQGADGVELDVRRTLDGSLALHHDDALPDGRRLVELRRTDLPDEMPVLAEALGACEPLDVVNIEIKNWPEDADFDGAESLVDAVLGLLRERGEIDDPRYLLSGFHWPTIEKVKALAPAVKTGWLLGDFRDPAPLIDRAAAGGHQAIHPHHVFVDEDLVQRAHSAGLQVITWTCDDPDRLRWQRDLGVDAAITNVPALAREALKA